MNDSTMYALTARVQRLREELALNLRDGRRGELVRDGVRIALAGPPNAGAKYRCVLQGVVIYGRF